MKKRNNKQLRYVTASVILSLLLTSNVSSSEDTYDEDNNIFLQNATNLQNEQGLDSFEDWVVVDSPTISNQEDLIGHAQTFEHDSGQIILNNLNYLIKDTQDWVPWLAQRGAEFILGGASGYFLTPMLTPVVSNVVYQGCYHLLSPRGVRVAHYGASFLSMMYMGNYGYSTTAWVARSLGAAIPSVFIKLARYASSYLAETAEEED